MLDRLIASQAPRIVGAGSQAFSAIAHGTLIAIAIAATQPATGGGGIRGRLHTDDIEHVTYVSPSSVPDALVKAAKRARDAIARAARQVNLPNLSLGAAALGSSIAIPDLDIDARITEITQSWLATPDGLANLSDANAGGLSKTLFGAAPNAAHETGGAYTPDMVERIVAPAAGNPEPHYPDALRVQGVEAHFTVRFVVDTTGQVDGSQIEVPRTVHRLFAAAVKAALLRSRYFPAMLGGRRVAQLVEQEFTFRMVP